MFPPNRLRDSRRCGCPSLVSLRPASALAVHTSLRGDGVRVLSIDEARAGGNVGAGKHAGVSIVQVQKYDRQIALEALLLVDREGYLLRLDQIDHARGHVEA